MNREQKRKAWKQMAHDKQAYPCPYCKHKTIWKYGEDNTVFCTVCENVVLKLPEKEPEEEVMKYPEVPGITPTII